MRRANRWLQGSAGAVLAALAMTAGADGESMSTEDVKKGSAIYSQNCSPCHGPRMLDPQGAFDLRTFPRDEKNRFLTSVSKGKNQMPPWGGLLSPADIEALWAYTVAGEK
jgi:mono/diheme cytochrome c family protein